MLIIIYCLVSLIIIIFCTYTSYKKRFIPGPPGPIGVKGDKGDKGDKGKKGDKGRMGQRGFRGLRGDNNAIQGMPGVDGYVGEKGPKGLRGFRGFKGKLGFRGERGPQGVRGNQGMPGQDGDRGIGGEYDYTLIDKATCRYYPFNRTTREMKCPYEHVLTGIKNEKDNYQGYCCKLKLNDDCTGNGIARKLLDYKPEMVGQPDEYKYLTVEEQDKILEAGDRYGSLTQLFYLDNYVCDSENESKPRLNGSIDKVRCCKERTVPQLKYLKYY